MKIGYLGLGKMGLNMVLRMREKGHDVLAWNRSEEPRREAEARGIKTAATLEELVAGLPAPRTLWLMVSSGAVDETAAKLVPLLSPGDLVVDGGNSHYTETVRRAKEIQAKGIRFMDAGTSGGPAGARNGACIMTGGDERDFKEIEPLLRDLSVPDGYAHMGGNGAGHFVKMVHNGIEYGMMQAIAEGFDIMRASEFELDLKKVADIYQHGSVIESRLVGWLKEGYEKYGTELEGVSSTVGHLGEGEWTVKAAERLGVPAPIIKGSFEFRVHSAERPSYAGKVLSTLRNMFGGHSAK